MSPQLEVRAFPASRATEASAGTGKTTELVNSMVEVLTAGASVSGLVAVTFTHAAAGEMKLRLRQALEGERNRETDSISRGRLGQALEHLEEAFVGTIHSFCAQLLRQRPVEAGIDPNFRELSPLESSQLFSSVFRTWLGEQLNTDSATLRRAFARLAWLEDKNEDPSKLLRDQAWNLAQWRDLATAWTRRPFDRRAETDPLLDSLIEIVEEWRAEAQTLTYVPGGLRPAIELAERAQLQRSTGCPDYDTWEAELRAVLIRKPKPHDFRFLRDVEVDRKTAIMQRFRRFAESDRQYGERADADFAVNLRDELWPVVQRYQTAKHRAGVLDFTDLLLSARDLMRNDDARIWLQGRYRHIFVDEFQDTDPLQAEMLLLLSSSNAAERAWKAVTPAAGKLFIVGDPKQSIYRFRRADVSLYRQVGEQLVAAGADKRELTTNYRSNATLESFVNSAFAERIPSYLGLEGGRAPISQQPAIVGLPIPHVQGKKGEVTKGAIESSAPKVTAAFVSWLVNSSGWKVSRRDGTLDAVRESDICILFRRFSAAVTRDYVRELEHHSATHVLIGSKSLHNREEVMVLRTALTAIEWPEDTLSVFALVHGPLFSIPDSTLIRFRHVHGALHPFRTLPEDLEPEFEPLRYALNIVRDLHKSRNYWPVAATINELLERTRAHAGFALRPGGERILANVTRLIDLARRYETTSTTSFRSFVEYLQEESEGGEANEAPLLEHDAEGVKLMTVHKAKGLEFPVVILADPTARFTDGDDGDRYVDSDSGICAQRLLKCAPWDLIEHRASESQAEREEADRVSYVAATRARDLLVVSCIGSQEWDGWLSPLNSALYPPRELWRSARSADWLSFDGGESVLDWDASGGNLHCVKPGLHTPQSGAHDVLWFDPAQLELDKEEASGIADKRILQGPTGPGLARYEEWKAKRANIVESGARPTFQVLAVTDVTANGDTEFRIDIVSVTSVSRRSRGKRFGTLVHNIIRDADFGSTEAALERLARGYLGKLGSIDEEEIASAVQVVAAILQHPVMIDAANSPTVHREYPVVYTSPEGQIVEGNIDLVYVKDEEWIIIDFKTGPASRGEYNRQVAAYGRALLPRRSRAILFEVL